jgi:polygalacturonase
VISSEDERRLDTERIQHAIDNCAAGKAVVVRAHGHNPIGLITLRSGVTLVMDANTSLVGSRDPRVYDVAPTAFPRGGISPIITLPGTSISSWATAKLSSITAKFIARPMPGYILPHRQNTIPRKTPALSSTGAGSLPART